MTNLLLSKFETYLLDEELELENQQAQVDYNYQESVNYEEYPPGFFSGL
ncbi:hypothetical protein [Ureibacillus chungkukjangi]|uniref:Uncharacterized protein n=1 Tax=Ureibacillus chungkukjangi TaxID=1202712 RepID=A0A318TAT5_9BACL|nr:hypothetical protein [Ureibacillus chungkukjangi]MCM3390023.1 hypothetical protein [Ureibacillus chungkukjangi]PYF02182.1 hypothetical protein BJ095_1475 [Ureibacillus chungkukjangi]